MSDNNIVIYLDLDHTLIPGGIISTPVIGVPELVNYLYDNFTLRWLTARAPNGIMPDAYIAIVARHLGIHQDIVKDIKGLDWSGTGRKLDGIAGQEHFQGRPFFWLEDGLMKEEESFLKTNCLYSSYIHLDVTKSPEKIVSVLEFFKTLAPS